MMLRYSTVLKSVTLLILFQITAFSFHPVNTFGQRYLQIEKHHTKTKLKYTTGDEITFRLKHSDQWITSVISEIDFAHDIVRLSGYTLVPDSIAAVRSYNPIVPPALGGALWRSGLIALANTLLYTIAFQPDNSKEFIIFFGGVTAAGLGLTRLSKVHRIYPIGKKYSIRLVDLNFYIPTSP